MSERPARILYVHPSDELYGSDRVLLELVSRLDRTRFAPQVLLSSDVAYAGRLSRRLEGLGVPVHRRRLGVLRRQVLSSPLRAGRFLLDVVASTAALALFLRRERIDLVHANTVTVFPAALAARLAGRPLVWHVHEIVTERPGRGVLHLMVRALADRVAVVSRAALAALGGERWPRPPEVIPNGVAAGDPRGAPADPPLIAYIGRLSERKGPRVFLEAAKLLADRHPAARFVFLGDAFAGGDLAAQLREDASRCDLADRVELRPFQEDVAGLLSEATAVVNPSLLPESFGLVILEAMAAGRPVVASDHGGPREIVVDGETGYLVPPGDAQALAGALDRLLSDRALAARMGEAARQRAAALFPIEASVRRFEELYEDMLRGAASPPPAPPAGRGVRTGPTSCRPSSPPAPRDRSPAS